MQSLTLVKAKQTDIDFLFDLRKQTMAVHLENAGIPMNDIAHKARIYYRFNYIYILWSNNQKVGMIKYKEEDTISEIMQLQVLPKYQGQGIGKQVIQKVIENSKKVTLKVLKQNPAKDLYTRCGFIITGQDDYEFFMEYNS